MNLELAYFAIAGGTVDLSSASKLSIHNRVPDRTYGL
jgi:hypothetical protein